MLPLDETRSMVHKCKSKRYSRESRKNAEATEPKEIKIKLLMYCPSCAKNSSILEPNEESSKCMVGTRCNCVPSNAH
ncbi:unnamed protein product [Nippostrongylus brasiliensis]|uniref:50S ribosomal protein L33 n=1 Tax=Nippostrongylus brasiliensis TaxID=27835 RepID=A0A0N4Y176_NIPBR|nr:unnamed protein product [Nippostrongylus brasiliensis]